jgi:Peroxiredoxin
MSLTIGQPAPQFKLVSSALKEVSLADFKGRKVIIHFFPMAFTGTCTGSFVPCAIILVIMMG